MKRESTRPFRVEVYTVKGRRTVHSFDSEELARECAVENFGFPDVSKVVLMRNGSKLQVWTAPLRGGGFRDIASVPSRSSCGSLLKHLRRLPGAVPMSRG